MKLSRLIEELDFLKRQHGDLEVVSENKLNSTFTSPRFTRVKKRGKLWIFTSEVVGSQKVIKLG